MNSELETSPPPDTPPWWDTYFGPDYLLIDIQRNTAVEAAFLCSIFKPGPQKKLLDCACGYGRHIASLTKRGMPVIGIDRSTSMLKAAARKLRSADIDPSCLVQGDLRSMPFEHTFDYAVCLFNSFGYFDAEDDNFRVLASVARALKPGGKFLLDVVNRDFVIRSMAPKDWFEHRGAFILERKRFDPVRSRSEIDVTVVDKRGKRSYHHSIRLYSFTELSMLMEAAGFKLQGVIGDFSGGRFDSQSGRMLVLANT